MRYLSLLLILPLFCGCAAIAEHSKRIHRHSEWKPPEGIICVYPPPNMIKTVHIKDNKIFDGMNSPPIDETDYINFLTSGNSQNSQYLPQS
jgi:hypothetical protein